MSPSGVVVEYVKHEDLGRGGEVALEHPSKEKQIFVVNEHLLLFHALGKWGEFFPDAVRASQVESVAKGCGV